MMTYYYKNAILSKDVDNLQGCRHGDASVLHEDAFYEFFRPYRHPQAQYDIWGGIGLETFGRDLELVKETFTHHPCLDRCG